LLFLFFRNSITLLLQLASDHNPPSSTSQVAGIRVMCYHTGLF
jgi:hypothetical protein